MDVVAFVVSVVALVFSVAVLIVVFLADRAPRVTSGSVVRWEKDGQAWERWDEGES